MDSFSIRSHFNIVTVCRAGCDYQIYFLFAVIVSTVEVDKLMDETTLNIITNIGGLTGGMFYIV